MAVPIRDRITTRVTITPDGCWLWLGMVDDSGYGRIKIEGKSLRTHRVSYIEHVGPIPDDLVLDHLCRNRACCNPEHLEPVTIRENLRRGDVPRGTGKPIIDGRCHRGHDLDLPNGAYVMPNGKRRCAQCVRDRARDRYLRLRSVPSGDTTEGSP